MGELKPEGDGPFDLPLAQQAHAFQNGDGVTLSFNVAFPSGGLIQKVRIGLTKDTALTLLGELKKALP
jgi:hypothetical protein